MGNVDVSDQRTIAYVRLKKPYKYAYITKGCITHEETFALLAYFIIVAIFTSQKTVINPC